MVKRPTIKKRGIYSRKQRKIILIGSEGKNQTEKIYFSHFNQIQKNYRINFSKGIHTDPVGVVRDLIKTIQSTYFDFDEGDIAFCLVDVDFGLDRCKQLNTAIELAKKNNIDIYFSNPCFEIWFLLHFRYSTKPYSSNEELVNDLKQYIHGYRKSSDIFENLYSKTTIAIRYAKKLENYHYSCNNDKYKRIPSTEVYKPIEKLLNDTFLIIDK